MWRGEVVVSRPDGPRICSNSEAKRPKQTRATDGWGSVAAPLTACCGFYPILTLTHSGREASFR
jgi:hypothetical protein